MNKGSVKTTVQKILEAIDTAGTSIKKSSDKRK